MSPFPTAMVPPNHISLLIADGRRAREWELGLRGEGVEARRLATRGSDAAKGEFWLVVPELQRLAGQRYVSAVLAGKRDLPRSAPLGGGLLWGAALIVLAMAAFVIAGLLTSS
ncbi:MAG: hypothetical protein GY811_23680 [Myxococcales bacterium]|nr:hypothetical protein [Myxococcales bacterium]